MNRERNPDSGMNFTVVMLALSGTAAILSHAFWAIEGQGISNSNNKRIDTAIENAINEKEGLEGSLEYSKLSNGPKCTAAPGQYVIRVRVKDCGDYCVHMLNAPQEEQSFISEVPPAINITYLEKL